MNERDDEFVARMNQIVKENSNVHKSFSIKQQNRIKELKKMVAAQKRGEQIDVASIEKDLRESGIIDSEGNICKRYRPIKK